jgi:hypothetical protein
LNPLTNIGRYSQNKKLKQENIQVKNVDVTSQGGTSYLPANAMSAGYSQIDDE